eukprot:420556-Pyramimonas_sp.AAC.1
MDKQVWHTAEKPCHTFYSINQRYDASSPYTTETSEWHCSNNQSAVVPGWHSSTRSTYHTLWAALGRFYSPCVQAGIAASVQ